MPTTIQCPLCLKLVSKSNISRHNKRNHKEERVVEERVVEEHVVEEEEEESHKRIVEPAVREFDFIYDKYENGHNVWMSMIDSIGNHYFMKTNLDLLY